MPAGNIQSRLLSIGLPVLLSVFVLMGCENPSETDNVSVGAVMHDSLFLQTDKDIRSVSFGDARENIVIGDGPNVLENEMNRVVERVPVTNHDSTYAECYYNFRDNRLTDAEIFITCSSEAGLKEIQASLQQELSSRFGSPANERGFLYWHGKSRAGYRTEIYLNASGNFNTPTLQITFRAELVEVPKFA